MAKSNRVKIILRCTEAEKEGKSPSQYHTSKNRTTTPNKLEKMKYNPFLRRYTVHREK